MQMKFLKNIWSAIITNKRNVGIGILLINQALKAFIPNLMTPEQASVIDSIGLFVGGAGVAHNGYNKVNENIAKANKNK